jgi:putative SOS response-associated peptidase YedK
MCGRYTLAPPPDELIEAFEVADLTFDYRPRYNVAPGQDCVVVGEDRAGRRIGLMRWGLLPAGVGRGAPLINARSESVGSKPSFRESFARRRCLVPADGFYEWAHESGGKTPYWFHPPGGGLLAMAGIWEGGAFAILTTEASDEVRAVHGRMPVLVGPADRGRWLSREADRAALEALLRPAPTGTLRARRVSRRVGSPSNDDPGLIREE